MGTSAEELDRLLENARWVRALGVELVGVSEADDLVQDAWVVALERPEAARNPAAWLGGVVRRLASRRRRGDARRARREQAVARPEPEPAADALVAEAELSRALIRAVTELDEPYRSTVLLRFYRGWTPEEIARSAGVPGATVRTRLARALAKLRERLDREHGGRAAWAFAFAAPSGGAAATTITGGALMTAKTLTGAAALAAGLGWMIWQGGDDREDGSARPEQGVAAADTAAPAGGDRLPPEPARAADEPARRAALDADPMAGTVLLYGSLQDEQGEPLPARWIGLEHESGGMRTASSARPGSWSVAELLPGRWTLTARAEGAQDLITEVELRPHDGPRRLDLVLARATEIPVRLVDEEGRPWSTQWNEDQPALQVVATEGPLHARLGGASGLDAALYGAAEYRERDRDHPLPELPLRYTGVLRLRAPLPLHVSVTAGEAVLDTRLLTSAPDELALTVPRAALEERLGSLRLRMIDETTGEPIGAGQVRLQASGLFRAVELAQDGLCTFERLAPGIVRLGLFDLGEHAWECGVRIEPGAELDLGEVRLSPAVTVRGRVVDVAGQPLNLPVRWFSGGRVPSVLDLPNHFALVQRGHFEVRASGGPLWLVIDHADWALTGVRVEARQDPTEGIEVRVERGVPVRFLPASVADLGAQVTIAEAGGVPLWTRTLLSMRGTTCRLVPARYQLWTGTAERVERREELVVPAQGVVLTLGAGGVVAGTTLSAEAFVPLPATSLAAPSELCVLHGRLLGRDGAPITGWKPTVVLKDGRGASLHTQAAEDGSYSLAGAAPGHYTLSVGTVGLRSLRTELELTLAEPIVRRDFTLERVVSLAIRVLAPDGRPFYQAAREAGLQRTFFLPVASSEPPGATLPAADGVRNDTLEEGAFWDYGPPVEDLEPGDIGALLLEGDAPVHVSLLQGIDVLETQRVEPGTERVTFVLDPVELGARRARLLLRALDAETRAPIAGRVLLNNSAGGGGNEVLAADGLARFDGIEPGLWELVLVAHGYEYLPRTVELARGEELDLGELLFARAMPITGRVLDADGAPVAVDFTLGRIDGARFERFMRIGYSSEPDGTFSLDGLPPGRYVFRTECDDEVGYTGQPQTVWVSGWIEVDNLAGPVDGLEVRLVRPALLVFVGNERLPEGSGYRLLDSAGRVLRASRFSPGFVERAKVPPGAYTLVLVAPDGSEHARRALELAEGTTELDVTH